MRAPAAWLALLAVAAVAPIAHAQTAAPAPGALSPEAVRVLERVLAGEPLQEIELRSRAFFFPSLQGGTLGVVAFRVGASGLLFGARDEAGVDAAGMPVEVAALELFGSLLRDGVEQRRFGRALLLPRSAVVDGISTTHSFAEMLPAGRHELVWGLRDAISGRAAARREVLDVPCLQGCGLQLSSVLVASTYRPAVGVAADAVAEGVRVFTATFDDDLERSFDRQVTPEISLTFIVSGAQPDPATAAIDVQIDYRVLDEQDGGVLRLPTQSATRATISQPIPIAQAASLEVGHAYRFEITVRDRIGGAQVVQLVPFRLRR